jgi:hypothetical protein
MSVVAIIVAVVLAFLAFRFVTGVIKFAVIAVIVIAVAWFLMQGGAA